MTLAELAGLLRERSGIDVETIGEGLIQQAATRRMAATHTDAAAYGRLIAASAAEFQEFINLVTIPETWFFRDREAFAALTRHAQGLKRGDGPIRILSLPCSSGEEAYSIVMAMFDAGFGRDAFIVEGLDISSRKIAEAQKAVYGKNAFRGGDLAFRERWFETVAKGWRPLAPVLAQARFRIGNLFETAPAAPYDVIFCRNLLIYFDRETQGRALERLRRLLAPDGMLLMGPAESSLPTLYGFASVRLPMAFAFVKQEAVAPTGKPPPAKPARPTTRKPPPTLAAKPAPPPGPRAPMALAPSAAQPDAPQPDAKDRSFAAIERSANAGRLEETKAAARDHIDRFGPSPEVFYLLGLAHDAGHAEQAAIEHYRKALYLAPDHRETLAHLSLLLARRGETGAAKVLSDRLGRLEGGRSR